VTLTIAIIPSILMLKNAGENRHLNIGHTRMALLIRLMRMEQTIVFEWPLGAATFSISGDEAASATIRPSPTVRLTIVTIVIKQVLCFEVVAVRDGAFGQIAIFVKPPNPVRVKEIIISHNTMKHAVALVSQSEVPVSQSSTQPGVAIRPDLVFTQK
jgi:hypothetical protein